MANKAKKQVLHTPATQHIRHTGKGVIGAIGRPPGFKRVVHPAKKSADSKAVESGRVGSCGTVYR